MHAMPARPPWLRMRNSSTRRKPRTPQARFMIVLSKPRKTIGSLAPISLMRSIVILNPSNNAAEPVAALATVRADASSRLSGISSAKTIQIIEPAAKPRPNGKRSVKLCTNIKAGTATSGCPIDETILQNKALCPAQTQTNGSVLSNTRHGHHHSRPAPLLTLPGTRAPSRQLSYQRALRAPALPAERDSNARALAKGVNRHDCDHEHGLPCIAAFQVRDANIVILRQDLKQDTSAVSAGVNTSFNRPVQVHVPPG
eukprot:scaffold1338_cov364-Prasinococcus_capsulatus_cf.AAC.2